MEFSAADLGRVRVASVPHPMWEVVLGINTIQSTQSPPQYRSWRARVFQTAGTNVQYKRLLAAAVALVPAVGAFPDFLTPPFAVPDVESHLDAMLSTPRWRLRADLDRTLGMHQKPPHWAKALYRDGQLKGVAEVMRRCHKLLVAPVEQAGDLQVEADRARFARFLLDGGTERLLENLHPSIRWRNPVLEGDYPVERTISLRGRGLVVIPAYFCWGAPVTFIDDDLPPTLIVPVAADTGRTVDRVSTMPELLGQLLGLTRARVLGELTVERSTTELATRLSISLPTVSQHAKVLRDARLVTTVRFGQSVRHALTPLGRTLLRG